MIFLLIVLLNVCICEFVVSMSLLYGNVVLLLSCMCCILCLIVLMWVLSCNVMCCVLYYVVLWMNVCCLLLFVSSVFFDSVGWLYGSLCFVLIIMMCVVVLCVCSVLVVCCVVWLVLMIMNGLVDIDFYLFVDDLDWIGLYWFGDWCVFWCVGVNVD